MKITKWALSAAIAATCLGGSALAEAPASPSVNDYYSDEAAPIVSTADLQEYSSVIPASCGCTESPVSDCCDTTGCDTSCDGGCDSLCGGLGCGLGCLEDINVGGWMSMGMHTANNTLFNQHDGPIRLNQAWLYAEKVADGSNGFGIGGRVDYLYGVDAQDTQAFGIENNHWDNQWDNGIYGHAIPQMYAEVAVGDVSIIAGHFFTLIGYEVVGAPGNFFYSHSYTMYNSEPFTHTGVLATYSASDALTLYGGYVSGWDSGFEDNGDSFLGGFSVDLADNFNVTNQYVIGRFGEGTTNEVGFMSSLIATVGLSDGLDYVFWADYLDSDGTGRVVERETMSINQYLLLTLTEGVVWGNRIEWYNVDKGTQYMVTDGRSDIYAFTSGFNLSPHEQFVFRPEIRWDWDKDNIAQHEYGTGQCTFGADAVFTF